MNNALNYRFLEYENGKYRETTQIGGRAKKKWDNLDSAKAYIRPNLVTTNEFLIVLSATKRIEDWYIS